MALHPNWADLYEAIAALDPSAEAIVHGDRRITWGEFDETTARLSAVFQSWGLDPGARVALYLFNVPEYIELAVGAFKARVVPINVNYRYRGDEVRHVLSDSGAEVLVFDVGLADVVGELAATGDLPARLVVVGGASFFGGRGSVQGAIVGVLIFGVINNGLNLLNVSTYLQLVAIGVIVVVAVELDVIRRRLEDRFRTARGEDE